jgi:hypothetical protein
VSENFTEADYHKRLASKNEEINSLHGELSHLRSEVKRMQGGEYHLPVLRESDDRSASENSRLDSSGGWDRLRQESE